MDLPSLSARLKTNVMRDSFSYTPPDNETDNENSREQFGRPGICVPHSLSSSEYDDIRRCFRRANVRAEGYLDCKELKVYMDLRKCPITQWEAEKILEYADTTYGYYISLEQVLNLATYFGIGTPHPLRLTRSEFEVSIKNVFRTSTSPTPSVSRQLHGATSREDFDFDGVVSYFESQSIRERSEQVELDEEQELSSRNASLGTEDMDMDILSTRTKVLSSKAKELGIQTYSAREITNLAYPKNDTSTEKNQDDEIYVDQQHLQPVKAVKEKWEHKIRELIANNGDDFLVKLSKQKKNVLKIAGKQKVSVKSPTKKSTHTQFPSKSNIPAPAAMHSLYRRRTSTQGKSRNAAKVVHEAIQTGSPIKRRLHTVTIKNNSSPPPLPPPMIPKVPKEWKSPPLTTILKK